MRRSLTAAALISLLAAAPALADAPADPATIVLTLKDHRFTPDHVTVPAGRPLRIELTNQDPASEEFDSQDLGVEKDVHPHGKVSFTVGPLKAGTYSFMGELHADTASGALTAVEDR